MRTFPLKFRREPHSNNASLKCLYEVLLHAEGEDTVCYAQAAHVAANLINSTVEELDSVHMGPLIVA